MSSAVAARVAARRLQAASAARQKSTLRERLEKAAAGGSGPLVRLAVDSGVSIASVGRSPMAQSLFDPLQLDCFDGNSKSMWVDNDAGWCHLCNEPFGTNLGVHMGDRDHGCLGLFLLLYSQYPRHSPPELVVHDAFRRGQVRLAANALGPPTSQEHLHTTSDAVRRSELEAILWHLTDGPNAALTQALKGLAPMALWVSGERIFKTNLSRMAATMLPPIAPGIHSTFTQKCWGRSNQERAYECLNVASIHRHYGVEPKTTRDSRAFFMRSLIWEMHTALDNRDVSLVARTLLEEALQRLSFELVFLQSMVYMNRIQEVVERLGGTPTYADLHALNLL